MILKFLQVMGTLVVATGALAYVAVIAEVVRAMLWPLS